MTNARRSNDLYMVANNHGIERPELAGLSCQIHGTKRVRMLPRTATFLHRGARSMDAAAAPEKPDLRAFPEWKHAHVVVEPGEALFIPIGWWHHVRSLGVAISFSLTTHRYRNDFGEYCPGAIGS